MAAVHDAVLRCLALQEPLVVHSQVGSDRKSIISTMAASLRDWIGAETTVVIRYVGSSPACLDVAYILSTVCAQIAAAFDIYRDSSSSLAASLADVNAFPTLRLFFVETLNAVAPLLVEKRRLVIILDGLDQLLPMDDAYSLDWYVSGRVVCLLLLLMLFCCY